MIYLMIQRWGTHADRVGNLKIIRLTSKLVSFIPLFWIISRNPVYLFLLQMASGLVWAGYNLCSANFIFDAVTPEKRTRCVAYFNVFNGLGICCGSLLGGFLVQRLPPFFGYKVLTLCVISSLLRFIVAFFMVQGLKEVRTVAKIKSADLFFSVIGVRPV
jgi:MFS family permease